MYIFYLSESIMHFKTERLEEISGEDDVELKREEVLCSVVICLSRGGIPILLMNNLISITFSFIGIRANF